MNFSTRYIGCEIIELISNYELHKIMSFESNTQTFLDWLVSQNVQISPKVEIRDLRAEGSGRGLVAKENIEEGEELFKIPKNALLNAENNSLIKKYPAVEEQLLDLGQWEALIIVLLYEWRLKNSPWKSYFDVLPISDLENYTFNQLVFWNEDEVKLLEPSLIVQRIGQDSAKEMYEKLIPLATETFGVEELKDVSLLEFNKIASLIMSYSFDVEADSNEDEEEDEEPETVRECGYFKSMVPFADTLNADTHLHNASLIYMPDFLVMKSMKAITKDQQVYNTYSDHPNAEILRRYGYVEQQGSTHDFGEIPLTTIKHYFASETSLSPSCIEDIMRVLNEMEDEEEEEIILDAYDCYASGEITRELIFLIQFLTVATGINDQTPFNSSSYEDKSRGLRRIFKKCYQLIEGGKLTKKFLKNYENIVWNRMADYPEASAGAFPACRPELTRQQMAEIVLISEHGALRNCLEIKKVFNGETDYSFIPDDKLLRNIMKKNIFDASEEPPKKKLKQA